MKKVILAVMVVFAVAFTSCTTSAPDATVTSTDSSKVDSALVVTPTVTADSTALAVDTTSVK